MLIDTHAHLTSQKFTADRAAVIERARQAGLQWIITIGAGCGIDPNRDALDLCEQYDFIKAAVGVHPHDAEAWNDLTPVKLSHWLKHPSAVAVGECGLDYFMGRDSFKHQQAEVFAAQCRLAIQHHKPVVVHTRDAFADTLAILKEHQVGKVVPGVIHFFTASRAEAEAYLEQGLYLSITGVVTLASAGDLPQIVATLPLERLMLETDCPYAAPKPQRGKRNEPAFVKYVAEKIAELRGITLSEVAQITSANARHFFDLPQRPLS